MERKTVIYSVENKSDEFEMLPRKLVEIIKEKIG